MFIPVFRPVDGEEVPHFVEVSEILVIAVESGRIVYKTKQETYFTPETLEDHHQLLANYGFERTDRSCLTKLQEVKVFNEVMRKLYFDDEDKLNLDSLFAEISEPHFKKVKKLPIKIVKNYFHFKKRPH